VIILVILLILPSLGGLTWWADSVRRYGLDRETRDAARGWLGVLGGVELAHAVGLALWQIAEFQRWGITPGSILWLIANGIMMTSLSVTGWAAFRVAQHTQVSELTLQEMTRRDLEHSRLTMGFMALIGLPLLLPGSLGAMMLPGILGANFAFFTTVRRSRENRLLWTLALAARHNLPLAEEVEMMAVGETRAWGRQLRSLATSLRHGTPLSQALLGGRRLLPAEIAAAIYTAEKEGTVADTLARIALRHSQGMRRLKDDSSLNNTAMYFWAATTVFLAISSFILYWIVPKFKMIFQDFGVELPASTRSFLSAADYFIDYWFLVLPLICFPFFVMFGLFTICVGGYRFLPGIIHNLWPRLAAPSILKSLAVAVERQTSPLGLLETLADTAPNWQLMSRYDRLHRRIESGDPLADSLREEGVVNGREAEALRHAEGIGHLSWSMTAIAEHVEDRRLRAMRNAVEVLKPLAILALGLMVLAFCVAMFQPIVQLMHDLS